MVDRILNLSKILNKKHSCLLLGPRGVGKTFLCRKYLKEKPHLEINLLEFQQFQRYLKDPSLIKKEVEKVLQEQETVFVFLDEVQKVPALLDEVHNLIQSFPKRAIFILSGSSARKLKRGGANLLAARAISQTLHPLSSFEVNMDLSRALQFGTLPSIYLEDGLETNKLQTYVQTYLKEEILEEALVRKFDAFTRFLDIAGQMHGEPLNFSDLAKECNIAVTTAQDYFSILTDTLVAFRLDGWAYSARKQMLQAPKFYFFDCGVLNAINSELHVELRPGTNRYGKLFESFVAQEFYRLNLYFEKNYKLHYWRTNTNLEVDLILSRGVKEDPIAVEIKSTDSPQPKHLKGLHAFAGEYPKAKLYCLCQTPRTYSIEGVEILPWRQGLAKIFEYDLPLLV